MHNIYNEEPIDLLLNKMNIHLNIPIQPLNIKDLEHAFYNTFQTMQKDTNDNIDQLRGLKAVFNSRYSDIQPFEKESAKKNLISIERIEGETCPTPIVSVDSSCIHIAETEEGSVYASRLTAVFSHNRKVVHYIRLGPTITYINESNAGELAGGNRYLTYLILSEPSSAEKLLRDKLESSVQLEMARNLKDSIIVLDGCLPDFVSDGVRINTDGLIRSAKDRGNVVIGISKTSMIKSLVDLSKSLHSSTDVPICFDVHQVLSGYFRSAIGRTFLVKFSNDGLVLRIDVGLDEHDESVSVINNLMGNDILFRGYPDSLRLAHHLSVFTSVDTLCLKALLSGRLDIKEIVGTNRRRLLLGNLDAKLTNKEY